jgi:hypothetical protein
MGLLGRPSEFDYPPLPPCRPATDRLYLTDQGKTLVATDGGTDLPTGRRLGHWGVGIYGGGDSLWQFTSPLHGPIQMKDNAELVAVVLAAEAIELQVEALPDGAEFIIDSQAVCFAFQA